ncbi:hypothetical protein CBR_g23702 [Chara braunii]|uniref:Reverse transcriptase domain-containing protein n=1 Tax=Chara braunii TaxID=69332 RepID=A0A388L4Z0_CHABU|nr:hypothetical protein CBR_g23702 [Chara braunii]|eukprot:GBG77371.1 hypothetical protein CBR_g23702 [Chara braunii]
MLAVRSSAKVGGAQLDCWRGVESERKCRWEEREIGNRHHLGKGQPREPLPDPSICHVAASWACWHRPRSRWSCETMGLVAPLAVRQHFECIGANSMVGFIHNAGKWRVVQLESMAAAALSPREKLMLPPSALRCKHCSCPLLRKREREGGEERCGERGRVVKGGGGGGLGRLHASRIEERAEGAATWQGPRKDQGTLRTISESIRGIGGRVVRARSGQGGLRLLLSSHVTCHDGGKRGGWSGSHGDAVWKSFSLTKADFNRVVDYGLLTWQVRRCDTSAKWVAEASPSGWSWWRQNRRADGGKKKEEDKKRAETDKEVVMRRKVKVTRVENPGEMVVEGTEVRFKLNTSLDDIKVKWLKERTVTVVFRDEARFLLRRVKDDLVRAFEDGWIIGNGDLPQNERRGRIKIEGPGVASYVAKAKDVDEFMIAEQLVEVTLGDTTYKILFKPWMTRVEFRNLRKQEEDGVFWVMALQIPLDDMPFIYAQIEKAIGKIILAHPTNADPRGPALVNARFDLVPEARPNMKDVLWIETAKGDTLEIKLASSGTIKCRTCKQFFHSEQECRRNEGQHAGGPGSSCQPQQQHQRQATPLNSGGQNPRYQGPLGPRPIIPAPSGAASHRGMIRMNPTFSPQGNGRNIQGMQQQAGGRSMLGDMGGGGPFQGQMGVGMAGGFPQGPGQNGGQGIYGVPIHQGGQLGAWQGGGVSTEWLLANGIHPALWAGLLNAHGGTPLRSQGGGTTTQQGQVPFGMQEGRQGYPETEQPIGGRPSEATGGDRAGPSMGPDQSRNKSRGAGKQRRLSTTLQPEITPEPSRGSRLSRSGSEKSVGQDFGMATPGKRQRGIGAGNRIKFYTSLVDARITEQKLMELEPLGLRLIPMSQFMEAKKQELAKFMISPIMITADAIAELKSRLPKDKKLGSSFLKTTLTQSWPETKLDNEKLAMLGRWWEGPQIWSAAKDTKGGVGILIHRDLGMQILDYYADLWGRWAWVVLQEEEHNVIWAIASVYAPVRRKERISIFEELRVALRTWTTSSLAGIGTRDLHPTEMGYTWFSHRGKGRRLDYLLVGGNLKNQLINIEETINPVSDHKPVTGQFNIGTEQLKGRGYFKLNTLNLQSEGLSQWTQGFWERWQKQKDHFATLADWWEAGSRILSKLLDVFSRILALNRNREERRCWKQVQIAEENMKRHPISELTWGKERARRLAIWDEKQQEKSELWAERLKVKGLEVYDRMTRETFQRLSPARTATTLKELRHPFDPEEPTTADPKALCRYAALYFQDILTSRRQEEGGDTDLATDSDHWNNTTVRLTTQGRLDLDRPIAKEEAEQALKAMANGKTPGNDGLPVEFYRKHRNHLGEDLVAIYNEVQMGGRLPNSACRGIISILFKKGDTSDIRNWRPILLLNVSYKILAKVLARRLGMYLPDLVEDDQAAFVRGRYIYENIVTTVEVLEVVSQEDLDVTVLLLDMEKAYDRVNWLRKGRHLNVQQRRLSAQAP